MIASILPVSTFSCSGEHTMFGPGEYVPDATEGIVDIKDLPRPQLVAYSRNHEHTPCPRCDHRAYRHKCGRKRSGYENLTLAISSARGVPCRYGHAPDLTTGPLGTDAT